ncbi:Uncharacterised protein [Campylobacter jejuni]|nr:Uncharacterised protein [Campylobacter jejuni]
MKYQPYRVLNSGKDTRMFFTHIFAYPPLQRIEVRLNDSKVYYLRSELTLFMTQDHNQI